MVVELIELYLLVKLGRLGVVGGKEGGFSNVNQKRGGHIHTGDVDFLAN